MFANVEFVFIVVCLL